MKTPTRDAPILTVVMSMFATAVSMFLLSLTIAIKLVTVQITKRNQTNKTKIMWILGD